MDRKHSPAMRRARARWGEAGLEARREIRARGLAPSAWIDDLAGRRRGVAVADGLTRLARELDEAGVGRDRVRALLLDAVEAVLDAATPDMPPRAA